MMDLLLFIEVILKDTYATCMKWVVLQFHDVKYTKICFHIKEILNFNAPGNF